jgi:transmembrane sensor
LVKNQDTYVFMFKCFLMAKKITADELIKNDSFINYCYRTNSDDVQKWQSYLLNYPDEIKVIQEAEQFILLMNQMLEEHSAEFSQSHHIPERIESISGSVSSEAEGESASLIRITVHSIRSMKKYIYYAAASVILIAGIFLLKMYFSGTPPITELASQLSQTADYETAIAQKKTIWLPDSTKVVLNAKTSLHIDKDFGKDTRIVTLIGEAFFDVTHNPKKPFIVQTNACKIKVLGTAFNVKAYPGETTSETSLLRGSIELTIKNDDNRKFLLKPDEKAIVYNKDIVIKDGIIKPEPLSEKTETIAIKKVTKGINKEDIAETAWTQNRLEMVNEKFSTIQSTLERWFGVTIHFNDDKVKDYQFTAIFEDETLEQVLTALKLSYPFHFIIKGKDVYISK